MKPIRLAALCSLVLVLAAGWAVAQDEATFGGMTCAAPHEAILDAVEEAYGEPCGVFVKAVAEDSLAAKTGIQTGDVVISVRLPNETDYYPIPPDLEDFARFADETEATDEMRLLILRKQGDAWVQIKCMLGTPLGGEIPEGQLEGHKEDLEAHEAGAAKVCFVPEDPDAVLAQTEAGEPLTQRDVDIFGALAEWAFRTRLTQAQRKIVTDSVIRFWKEATPQDVQGFNQGIRAAPAMFQGLTPQWQEMLRPSYAQTFLNMAQQDPEDPLSKVILEVSGQANRILAGEGTEFPFTQQDADALLEYIGFQYMMATGLAANFTDEQRKQLIDQAVETYNKAPEAQKRSLSQMDVQWALLRAQWEQAQQQQQQALMQQWQQSYQQQMQQQQQANPQGQYVDPYTQGYLEGEKKWAEMARNNPRGSSGSGVNPATLGIMQNMIDMEHATSMGIINNMGSGPTTDVFNNDGLYMYSY